MTKKEFESFISSLDKEEFENFYRTHSNKVVMEKYNLSKYYIDVILDKLNISRKTPEEKNSIISNTLICKTDAEKAISTSKRLNTRNNWSDEYRAELTDKQRNIRLNFTSEQKQHQIDSFHNTMKSKTSEELALIKKHKSDATKNYFDNLSDNDRKQFSEKMSKVYANLSDEVKEARKRKISETYTNNCISKYGVSNILKLDSIKDRIKETVKNKYGVDYACQLPQCRWTGNDSSINNGFKQFLIENSLYISDEENREYNIDSFSYDFKINNILIELNPTATHNSTWSPFNNPKDIKYHFNKTKLAIDNGYRCINIWDWDDYNKILNLLIPMRRVYARNCDIKIVDKYEAGRFIDSYHLQGYAKSDINIGLYYNEELVSIMTFGKPRYNKNYQYELIRYCSSMSVVGGAEKLFKHFIQLYNPHNVISYCDLSKFTGKTYVKLGFTLKSVSIGKHWYNMKTGRHITDNLLRSRGYDQLFGTSYGKNSSNEELMLKNDFVEIYDAGQATYIYINEDN